MSCTFKKKICPSKSSPFSEQGTEKGDIDQKQVRYNFCKNPPKRMKRSAKYKEINKCLLEIKVLRNILRIFPKMVLFRIKIFEA